MSENAVEGTSPISSIFQLILHFLDVLSLNCILFQHFAKILGFPHILIRKNMPCRDILYDNRSSKH
jgi:hypothetical protein